MSNETPERDPEFADVDDDDAVDADDDEATETDTPA